MILLHHTFLLKHYHFVSYLYIYCICFKKVIYFFCDDYSTWALGVAVFLVLQVLVGRSSTAWATPGPGVCCCMKSAALLSLRGQVDFVVVCLFVIFS